MQPNSSRDKEPKGRAGVLDQEEGVQPGVKPQREPSAADEARAMLDELAGLGEDYRATHKPRPDIATTFRAIALSPLILIRAIIRLIIMPFRQADFRLAGEMRKFLKSPGNFFWFNRIAPERAAEHFGTSSTDAMTHHARRYGAHVSMLILAVVVVLFGGFSGLATRLMSADAKLPNGSDPNLQGVVVEDGREVYVSGIAADLTTMPHRTETIVIKDGDTLRKVAAQRGLSIETLLWANNLVDPDSDLKPGQKLIIPPTTGMLHIANQGDTVGKVAERYGVDPKVIIDYPFNQLSGGDVNTQLHYLQEVMVPGGSMPQRSTVFIYNVRSGDTLKDVAGKFGLKPDTLLDNNELDDGLKVGQGIRIPPVDGLIYTVKKGDTLNGVAAYLSTSPENIINFTPNNVARNVPLKEGQSLIVPGGSWPPPPPPPPEVTPTPTPPKPAASAPAAKQDPKKPAPAVAPQPNRSQTTTTGKSSQPQPKAAPAKSAPSGVAVQKPAPKNAISIGSSNNGTGVGSGSFIWPIHGVITTYFGQPIWYGIHMGLDIATQCGTPTVASDSGTVVLAAYDGGYGNSVVIDHGNGFKTRYGHFISLPPVHVGQRVTRGQVIGYEGSTGASTGCHVHFEVLVNGQYTDPLRWLK